MSMLNFEINRAGRNLSSSRKVLGGVVPGLGQGPRIGLDTKRLHHALFPSPMGRPDSQPSIRVLSAVERFSAVLYGVTMAVSFTGTLSIAQSGEADIRTLLIAALGCNLAWGFVDGAMYVVGNLMLRGHRLRLGREIRIGGDAEGARRALSQELGAGAELLADSTLEAVRRDIAGRVEPAERVRVQGNDLWGALAVFLITSTATAPVTLPFLLHTDAHVALRISNGVALGMLFLGGVGLGRYAQTGPIRTGLIALLLGVVVVAVILALGG